MGGVAAPKYPDEILVLYSTAKISCFYAIKIIFGKIPTHLTTHCSMAFIPLHTSMCICDIYSNEKTSPQRPAVDLMLVSNSRDRMALDQAGILYVTFIFCAPTIPQNMKTTWENTRHWRCLNTTTTSQSSVANIIGLM